MWFPKTKSKFAKTKPNFSSPNPNLELNNFVQWGPSYVSLDKLVFSSSIESVSNTTPCQMHPHWWTSDYGVKINAGRVFVNKRGIFGSFIFIFFRWRSFSTVTVRYHLNVFYSLLHHCGTHKINHHITECSHPHFCILNSCCGTVQIRIRILPPRAAAWAKAEPKPAVIDGSGPACGFRKPEPSKARPKPRLSGQAGPAHHYLRDG